jgi:hypothetical protein
MAGIGEELAFVRVGVDQARLVFVDCPGAAA